MSFKLIGAVFIVVACGCVGFKMANNHIKEEKSLRQLIAILDYMECELQYRLTPLPQLCRQAAGECSGTLQSVFHRLAIELEDQISPNVERCMSASLNHAGPIPQFTNDALELLGKTLGRFDLNGQLKGLEAVRHTCRKKMEQLNNNRDVRLRSYQTLGLCAGAAMAILLI